MRPLLLLPVALLTVLAAARPAAAQDVPDTDVYLLDLTATDTALSVGPPRNVTGRAGYDNQPAFLPDGRSILYASQRDGQTDIYRYDLDEGDTERVTDTATSEYSPTPVPGGDAFTVVRVEPDGTQRLWRFALGGAAPALVLPDVRPVGYHAWRDASTLALFVLGEPPTLRLADPATGAVRTAAQNIGRALHVRPGTDRFSFIDKSGDAWWVAALDPATGAAERLVATRPGREDVCWTPDGTLLQGDGATLWAWRPGAPAWTPVAEFDGLADVTRCAVSPDGRRLALVATPAP